MLVVLPWCFSNSRLLRGLYLNPKMWGGTATPEVVNPPGWAVSVSVATFPLILEKLYKGDVCVTCSVCVCIFVRDDIARE